jgi:hypothetical protein
MTILSGAPKRTSEPEFKYSASASRRYSGLCNVVCSPFGATGRNAHQEARECQDDPESRENEKDNCKGLGIAEMPPSPPHNGIVVVKQPQDIRYSLLIRKPLLRIQILERFFCILN